MLSSVPTAESSSLHTVTQMALAIFRGPQNKAHRPECRFVKGGACKGMVRRSAVGKARAQGVM